MSTVIGEMVPLALASLLILVPPGTGGPTTLSSLLRLLGALLLFLGIRQWQRLPKAGQEPSLPRWMAV